MLRGSPDRAVIWVFGKQDGAVVAVEDEWGRGGFDSEEVTEDDEDYGVRRLRFGHPGFGCGGLARNAPWQSEYAAQREPKLLGFYVTSEFTTGSSNEGMYLWWDMERMLVELSA